MRIPAVCFAASLLGVLTLSAVAQERKEPQRAFYKVEFIIHDGSPAASKAGRRYVMTVDTLDNGIYRVGSRVPYVTGPNYVNNQNQPTPQFQYMDVGVNIDCRLQEAGPKVALRGNIDVSSFVPAEKGAAVPNPTLNTLRISLNSLVSPGHPAVVGSIDDPVTMRKFEVEAVVTKVE